MTLEDLLPSKNDPQVLSLCERICPGQRPFYVPVEPEDESESLECFPNVERKIKSSGGSIVYGWHISLYPKIHLEAQFHAIWKSPTGQFLDITPEDFDAPKILFLIDAARTYTGLRVPHERFALGDKKVVERYWDLSDQSQEVCFQLIQAGFPPGHPVYAQRLGWFDDEIERLKVCLGAT